MKVRIGSPDERALKLANELRHRVKKRAAKLREQRRGADLEPSDGDERARLAVKAVGRRLKDAISILETRRAVFARLVEHLSRDDRLNR
jgi:hypothetical protein